jgi:hypothetical protein
MNNSLGFKRQQVWAKSRQYLGLNLDDLVKTTKKVLLTVTGFRTDI